MSIRIRVSDVLWSYAAQVLQFGSGVFLLPIVLRMLPDSEMGLWYTFLAVVGLVSLLDFGFQNTISVNVSYVFSGARRLLPEGFDSDSVGEGIDADLFAGLVTSVHQVYLAISLGALVLMGSLGSWYIHEVAEASDFGLRLPIAWCSMILATSLMLYSGMYQSLLQGRGLIRNVRISTIASRIGFIVFSVIGLQFGLGLASMSFGMLAQSTIGILICRSAFWDATTRSLFAQGTHPTRGVFAILLHNAKKMGIVSIGAFLINRGNILICAFFLSPAATAKFGLTMQLFGFLTQFAQITFYTFVPKLNACQLTGDAAGLRRFAGLGFLSAFILMAAGGIGIVVVCPILLQAIGSRTELLDPALMGVIWLMLLLEVNHSLAAGMIATRNVIPFVKPALLSGGAIIGLSAILARFTDLQVWSLILPQVAVQLSYNNWKWPIEMRRDLGFGYRSLFLGGLEVARQRLQSSKVLRGYLARI